VSDKGGIDALHLNYIDGRFEPVSGAERIAVLNPASGVEIAAIPDTPPARVSAAIAAAAAAQPACAKRLAIERAGHLRRTKPCTCTPTPRRAS